jgi:ABC-2 type transport system ATP-binding protein
MIKLHNISKRFDQREVLSDISLTIQAGEVVLLKGENGSGKTTLLNIILGIVKPDRGEVKLCGRSPKDPNSKTHVGVMLQKVEVPRNLKVTELISLMRSYYPNPLSTEEILDKVDLKKESNNWAYSGLTPGQRKRFDLGIALAGNPNLLILDEPTAGLDEKRRKEFWQLLRRCIAKGVTVLIVTHISSDWQELETLATRSITIEEGQLLDKSLTKDSTSDLQVTPVQEEKASTAQAEEWSKMFMAHLQTELLQLIRTPIYLLGIAIFCFITSRISSPDYGALGLVFCGGLAVLTFAIERVGKQIALERVEGWLKLLRVTPLQPTAYLAAKLAISMLILAGILILVIAFGASKAHGTVTLGNQFSLFLSLLIGVIPFAIAGSALGYLVKPKSLDQIAGLSIPVALFTCGLPVPGLPKDIVALSPFYHYGQFALWSIGSEFFDHHFMLHILWLLTAGGAFSILAVWAYQRDDVLQ